MTSQTLKSIRKIPFLLGGQPVAAAYVSCTRSSAQINQTRIIKRSHSPHLRCFPDLIKPHTHTHTPVPPLYIMGQIECMSYYEYTLACVVGSLARRVRHRVRNWSVSQREIGGLTFLALPLRLARKLASQLDKIHK